VVTTTTTVITTTQVGVGLTAGSGEGTLSADAWDAVCKKDINE